MQSVKRAWEDSTKSSCRNVLCFRFGICEKLKVLCRRADDISA